MKCSTIFISRGRHNHVQQVISIISVCVVGIVYLGDAKVVQAAGLQANSLQNDPFPLSHVFTFLLLMLGPFKIIGPFAKLTKGGSSDFIRQAAFQSTLFSTLALGIAAIFGEMILRKYGIPLPILSLAVGMILFLVAILSIVQQFTPTSAKVDKVAATESVTSVALTPLAFPTIVTPYGVGALVVFLALSPDLRGQVMIAAALLVIMLLNLSVMLVSPKLPPVAGVLLQILGAVLAVVQVALGLQIANNSLKALGVL